MTPINIYPPINTTAPQNHPNLSHLDMQIVHDFVHQLFRVEYWHTFGGNLEIGRAQTAHQLDVVLGLMHLLRFVRQHGARRGHAALALPLFRCRFGGFRCFRCFRLNDDGLFFRLRSKCNCLQDLCPNGRNDVSVMQQTENVVVNIDCLCCFVSIV